MMMTMPKTSVAALAFILGSTALGAAQTSGHHEGSGLGLQIAATNTGGGMNGTGGGAGGSNAGSTNGTGTNAGENMTGGGGEGGQAKVELMPLNKKGEAASAFLTQQGKNLLVTITAPPAMTASGAQAAIYKGECSSSGKPMVKGSPSYRLSPVKDGSSKSTLRGVTLNKLTSGKYAIVVRTHPSYCGDVANLLPPQKP